MPSPPVLTYCSGLVVHQGASARLIVCIAQLKLAVMSAVQLLRYAFYSVEDDIALHLRLKTHDSVMMYLPSADFGNIHKLGFLHMVPETQYDAAKSIIALERLRDLN